MPDPRYVNIDPTRTTTLRARFEADMIRRFKKVRKYILESIIINDVFGLRPIQNQALAPKQFQFLTTAEKHQQFMIWLEDLVSREILDVIPIPGVSTTPGTNWTDVYIRSGYQKGLIRSRAELAKVGLATGDPITAGGLGPVQTAFFAPIHSSELQLLYSRVFTTLKGVTQAMDSAISQTLAQGFAEGRGLNYIGSQIAKNVDGIGIVRGRMIARTEIIRAHHLAHINEYTQFGIEGVEIIAEFLTAGDARVCATCAALAGRRYTIEEAKGLIPVHPNCRCTTIPILPEDLAEPSKQTPEQIRKIAGLNQRKIFVLNRNKRRHNHMYRDCGKHAEIHPKDLCTCCG